MSFISSKVASFAGGVLFGIVGVSVLGSKDAKNVYTHITAAVLRCQKEVMSRVDICRENCNDILADAKEINEKRAAEKEEATEIIEDAA